MKKEKIINFKKYEDFKKDLEAGELLETSIIFIDDLPGIYTHGTLFYCSSKPIIAGELAPDPEEPEEPTIHTVTFEFDEGIKEVELYGKTISTSLITKSGDSVQIEDGEGLTWMANYNDGFESGTNCNGSRQIYADETITMTSKSTVDTNKINIKVDMDEGVNHVTIQFPGSTPDLLFYESGTQKIDNLKQTKLHWFANLKEGYVATSETDGDFYANADKEIVVTTEWVGVEEPDYTFPEEATNKTFIYKTDNNAVVNVSSFSFNTPVVSNVYDAEKGYCTITFQDDLTTLPDKFFNTNDHVLGILYVPSTVKTIGAQVFKNLGYLSNNNNFDQLLNLSNIEEVAVGEQFCYALPKSCTRVLLPKKITSCSGKDFLTACYGLTYIDTDAFKGCTTIGTSFMSYDTHLETVDLSGLQDVTSMGASAFTYSNAIRTFIIDVPGKVLSTVLNAVDSTVKANIESIYVNDDMVDQYKSQITGYSSDVFKPLSEYNL